MPPFNAIPRQFGLARGAALMHALAVLIPLLALSQPAIARIYYVSPAGSNSSSGTSSASAWRSINYAMRAGSPVRAGDEVRILSGTYRENVDINKSGEPALPITIKGMGNVVIKDPSPWSGRHQGVVDVVRVRHIVIDNIAIERSYFFGFMIRGSHDITIQNSRTFKTGASGIIATNDKRTGTKSSQIQLLNNIIERPCYLFNKPGQGGQEGISLLSVDGFEVAFNKVIDSGKEGIDAKVSSRNGRIHHNTVSGANRVGIYVDGLGGSARNIRVDNNLSYRNGHGFAVSNEGGNGHTQDITIENNIAYLNRGRGIQITHWGPGPRHFIDNVRIVNNTVAKNGSIGISVTNPDASNILIRNNIAYANKARKQISITAGTAIVVDHNLERDPKFRDLSLNDFYPQWNSPAIDAGSNRSAPGSDFNSRPRPQGSSHDIGAYEVR